MKCTCNVTLVAHVYSRPSQLVVSLKSTGRPHFLLLFMVINMLQNVFTVVRVFFVHILPRKFYNLHVYVVSLLNLFFYFIFLPPFIIQSAHYKTISTIYVVEPKILHCC